MSNSITIDDGRGKAVRHRGVTPNRLRQAGDKADALTQEDRVYRYDSLEEAFPKADPGFIPAGSNVLFQIRTPPRRSKGGLWLPDDVRETDQWNTQVAKVISFGEVAFRNRETLAPWPEGNWVQVGEYARVPKYGGDRWWVDSEGADKKSLFVVFNDLDIVGRVPEDKVLSMVAYVL